MRLEGGRKGGEQDSVGDELEFIQQNIYSRKMAPQRQPMKNI